MDRVLRLTYALSLTGLCEINSSFDTGVLRIAYTGQNRNGSYISKEAFERCVKTMYNCPIVCNYDRDSDTFGGHDIEVVRDDDGSMRLVNLTTPVGCIRNQRSTGLRRLKRMTGLSMSIFVRKC